MSELTVHKDGRCISRHDARDGEFHAAMMAIELRRFYGPRPRITVARDGVEFLASAPTFPGDRPVSRLAQAIRHHGTTVEMDWEFDGTEMQPA